MREPPQDDNNMQTGKTALPRRRRPRDADSAVMSALTTALREPDHKIGLSTKPSRPEPHVQVWRAGLMAASMALIAGGLGWLGGLLAVNSQQDAFAVAGARPAWVDPLEPYQAAQVMEQEARLASVTIDLRETQESVLRVWNEARSAAAKIEALATSMEGLKSDLNGTRSDIVVGLARVEDRLRETELAASARASHPDAAPDQRESEVAAADTRETEAPAAQVAEADAAHGTHAEAQASIAEPSATADIPMTGALPEAAPPQKTAAVARPRTKRQKRVAGWFVHNVSDDLALVEGHGQHYEVRVGELLPEVGVVEAIKKHGQEWVVITKRGFIPELP